MLGTDLTEFAADLAEQLEESVELDPRDLVLPGILVVPGPITFDRLDGDTASLDLELWLIAGDTNPNTALNELTALFLKLRGTLDSSPTEIEPITVKLPSQGTNDPLPAFRCPIQVTLKFSE